MTTTWLLLALAPLGGLGALLRWRLQRRVPLGQSRLITGVLVANTLGAGIAGLLIGFSTAWWAVALLVGLCGSLTTLSTLAVEIAGEIRRKAWGRALGTASVHVVFGMAAFFLGLLAFGWLGL